MPSLCKLTSEYIEIEHALEQEEDKEDKALYEFLLDTTEEELALKVDNYVGYYRDLKATAEKQKEEAKHLRDMAKANENKAERLKAVAKWAAGQLRRSKLRGNIRTITVTELKKPAIDVKDVAKVPTDYKEQVLTWKVDKKGIAEHLMETGELVGGVEARKVVRVLMR